MHPRRTFLRLAAGALALAPGRARAQAPVVDRQLARRLELWAKAAAGTRALVARYALTRQSTLLKEPLKTAGTLLARAPDTLVMRDDTRDGVTTRLARGRLEIRPNDPALPALAEAPSPTVTWLFEHVLALFCVPEGAGEPTAALQADARLTVPRGPGHLLAITPRRDHPARREIRDLVVHLDPHTGDVDQLDLVEAGGDKLVITFSQRRRDAGEDEIAALLQPT
ncbi:hypothetical protein OV079_26050 [Nannocystis pusilla]|uniref:Outer membrane lipoprotein carrier protein LolA n=1 Tax=Nannocystis pusilla TaxID=889268 RepID=A0A9X3ERF7_9BACT|nr:hypothetical protein [Nannocystis pusilla]MCY1008957.1 hypothetical protein [Nannocystis pusilla]